MVAGSQSQQLVFCGGRTGAAQRTAFARTFTTSGLW